MAIVTHEENSDIDGNFNSCAICFFNQKLVGLLESKLFFNIDNLICDSNVAVIKDGKKLQKAFSI